MVGLRQMAVAQLLRFAIHTAANPGRLLVAAAQARLTLERPTQARVAAAAGATHQRQLRLGWLGLMFMSWALVARQVLGQLLTVVQAHLVRLNLHGANNAILCKDRKWCRYKRDCR
jgi:hypothetical protein